MATVPSIRIGKLTSKKALFPSEPGYMAQCKATTKEMTNVLLRIIQDITDVSPPVMLNALQPTFEKSLSYCPIDTGDLRASGYLEVTEFRGNPRVELGYARGGNPSYAVVVHENMELFHKPPTRAKWLQAAMMEDLGQVHQRLADGYKRATGL